MNMKTVAKLTFVQGLSKEQLWCYQYFLTARHFEEAERDRRSLAVTYKHTHVMAITSEEEEKYCCVDGPLIA
jgi:hypothetical protein